MGNIGAVGAGVDRVYLVFEKRLFLYPVASFYDGIERRFADRERCRS